MDRFLEKIIWIIRPKASQRWYSADIFIDMIVEPIFGFTGEPPVEKIEADSGRADACAFVAAGAPAREVHGPRDVPRRIPLAIETGRYPLRPMFVRDARVAIAHRAHGSTSITAQTPIKLPLPIVPPFWRCEGFKYADLLIARIRAHFPLRLR